MLGKLGPFFSKVDVLKQATSVAARYLAEGGIRDPYPAPLGVVKTGAWADLLLVDGDPTADLGLFATPERAVRGIMKNGAFARDPS